MPFEFPNAPVAGDTHSEFGVDYVYDGTVWNLAAGGDLTDYVLKVGDTMTGPLYVQSAPASSKIGMLPGDASNNGRIEWTNPDGTRKAYLGYGPASALHLNLDGATTLNVQGGDVIVVNGGLGIGDMWHGWKWNSTYNGEVLTSYQGKYGFHRCTSGTGNGDLLAQIDTTGWVSGGSGRLGPPANYNVVWQNNFAGTMDFRVNPAMVSMRVYGVKKTANALSGNTSTKICDYPSGVPAPWGTLRAFGLVHNSTAYGVQSGGYYWLEARTDGVWLLLYGGSSMNVNDHQISGTITWAR